MPIFVMCLCLRVCVSDGECSNRILDLNTDRSLSLSLQRLALSRTFSLLFSACLLVSPASLCLRLHSSCLSHSYFLALFHIVMFPLIVRFAFYLSSSPVYQRIKYDDLLPYLLYDAAMLVSFKLLCVSRRKNTGRFWIPGEFDFRSENSPNLPIKIS